MNIVLLGSGGREHTLAWKISQSPQLTKLYTAPGNAGTSDYGTNVDLNPNDFENVKAFAKTHHIKYIVVGPEEPLVNGIADYFTHDNTTEAIVIGPNQKAAQLEGSKDFAKNFMLKHGIPTAMYKSFTSDTYDDALSFLKDMTAPYVLKADGLAAGKGVIICPTYDTALKELEQMLLGQRFGKASQRVVIENFLDGIEMSVFVVTDGKNFKMLPHAKDYKKIGEKDTGPNTGGMGAVSPVPFVDKALLNNIEHSVVAPTIKALKTEEIDYRGFLFFGLMIVDGLPYVIEYNVRLGDPETEVILPLMQSDIIDMFQCIENQNIENYNMRISDAYATTVMMVSGGYPGSYNKGEEIILPEITDNDCRIFHAGTLKNKEDRLVTNGGRVIAVTAFGDTLEQALQSSYKQLGKIHFDKCYYRKDIGKDLLPYITRK